MSYQTEPTATTDLFQVEPVIYANFGDRFGAAFLDGLILIIPNFLFGYFLGESMGNILAVVLGWLYGAIQESGTSQATIGKKALRLKVINKEGGRISFAQATGRHFGKYVSAIILLIGYFMMLWDEKKQTLHDKMANTYVVKG